MNRISISQAWAHTTSFFSDQHANHAIALIGVGIFGATVIQLLMGGGAVAMDPATLASGTGAIAALGATAFLAGIIGYVLQTGSYFASWRMGLAPGQETIGSALGYGMIASLPVLLVTIAFILVIGLVLGLLFGTAFIPLLMGRQPSPESMVGTAGLVLVAMPLFLVFFLWIAARFCVMGPIMADDGGVAVEADGLFRAVVHRCNDHINDHRAGVRRVGLYRGRRAGRWQLRAFCNSWGAGQHSARLSLCRHSGGDLQSAGRR